MVLKCDNLPPLISHKAADFVLFGNKYTCLLPKLIDKFWTYKIFVFNLNLYFSIQLDLNIQLHLFWNSSFKWKCLFVRFVSKHWYHMSRSKRYGQKNFNAHTSNSIVFFKYTGTRFIPYLLLVYSSPIPNRSFGFGLKVLKYGVQTFIVFLKYTNPLLSYLLLVCSSPIHYWSFEF